MRDIVIVGGGLVGLCATLALRHPARWLTLIEATDLNQPPAGGLAARSIALSASSVQIFRALGVWPQLEQCAAPIRHIHVSARGRWGVTRLEADDYDIEALGYVVESGDLHRVLLQAVSNDERVELVDTAIFESIEQSEDSVNLGYRRKNRAKNVEAAFALIADGARSQAREAIGIGHRTIDYGQSVVICNVEFDQPREATAYERFTAEGPLAMLPLGAATYASVWTMTQARAQTLSELGDEAFSDALQECFGYRLGFLRQVSERFSIPIVRTRADALVQGRCWLAGNAANALHPVAGQSFNLSLRDLACLYELLAEQELSVLEVDDVAAIADEYQRRRENEQRQVIRYGDGLVTLFSNELPLFGMARAAGLGLLDLLPALKAQAALAGMGMTFGGNRLLRGHL